MADMTTQLAGLPLLLMTLKGTKHTHGLDALSVAQGRGMHGDAALRGFIYTHHIEVMLQRGSL